MTKYIHNVVYTNTKVICFPNPSHTGTDLLRCGTYDQKRSIKASTCQPELRLRSFSSQMYGVVVHPALSGHRYRQPTKNNCRKRQPPFLMALKTQAHRHRLYTFGFFLSRCKFVEDLYVKVIQLRLDHHRDPEKISRTQGC